MDSRPHARADKSHARSHTRPNGRSEKLQMRPPIAVSADQVLIYGRHPVAAALLNQGRHIKAVYVTDDAKSWLLSEYADHLDKRGLTPILTDRDDLADALPPQDKHVHQGVIVVAKPLSVPLLEDWLNQSLPEKLVLLMLDQITDARNIGAIMRSALAFGASAMIATDRNTPIETGAMLRAASGAAERMPLIRVVNLARAITLLQDHGFTVAGLDAHGTDDLTGLQNDHRLALVLGAEGSGLRHLTRQKVDQLIRIPISEHSESLNVSNAAAVALYAATAGDFNNKKNH